MPGVRSKLDTVCFVPSSGMAALRFRLLPEARF
jgi:hypothetical protein